MKNFEETLLRWVAMAAGVFLVLFPSVGGKIALLTEDVTAARAVFILLGVLIFIAGLTSWLTGRSESLRKTLTVHTQEGDSIIALNALENILRDELRMASDVHDVKVYLSVKGPEGPIRCLLRFKLDSQADIPGRTDAHKRVARDSFARLIPTPLDLQIVCRVDDIVVAK
ncbi:MAG: hypothetical protein V1918_05855, partial [Planctomycetota bacterium]